MQNKQECCGCHACYSICPVKCIDMKTDEEGFWYPVIDETSCIKCGLCKKVCPLKENQIKKETYACINIDDAIRKNSSSGGVFTLIAEYVIDKGGVVFGAQFDKTFKVVHCWTDKKEDLYKFRGSKYVQSVIGICYQKAKEYLESEKTVFFTGTPCQIGGLKSYLGKKYEKLICMDIICHGVPSPLVWKCYIEYQQKINGQEIEYINFRNKTKGWKLFSTQIRFRNSLEYMGTLKEDIFMKGFLQDLYLRPSCYACGFKTLNRESDLTIADFWGIEKIEPKMDDNKGTSLVILHTEKGKQVFDELSKYMKYEAIDLMKAIQFNSSMVSSVKKNKKREEFFADLDKMRFDYLIDKYCSASVMENVKRCIKKLFVGG